MLRNYLTETDLQGYAVKLTELNWTDETDYTKQKTVATEKVFNHFTRDDYDLRQLMPHLTLRSSGAVLVANETSSAVEDTINRRRIYISDITFTGQNKTITLQGSEDGVNWYTTKTITLTISDTFYSGTFTDTYQYYRLVSTVDTGSLDYKAVLVETVFDELFAFKWLWWIYYDMRKKDEDQFDIKMKELEAMYDNAFNNTKFYLDTDEDEVPDASSRKSSIKMLK